MSEPVWTSETPAPPEPEWCEACLHMAYPGHDCGNCSLCDPTYDRCPNCRHLVETGADHACCDRCDHIDWQFTTDDEFPIEGSDACYYVGAGDDCWCHRCQRLDTEHDRRNTETYWRDRISVENRRTTSYGLTRTEDDRKPERDALARAIADSEAFMWLMVGANHPDAHLQTLRKAWSAYADLDGGYGRWKQRHLPLTDEQRSELDARLAQVTEETP